MAKVSNEISVAFGALKTKTTGGIYRLDEEQYLIKSELGQELIDNSRLFLSKRAIKSFGGYADAQLRRLQNAIARDALPQSDREKHILKSVMNA